MKINKPLTPLTPQELAHRIVNEGLKNAVDKAISSASDDYRAQYKNLLGSKKETGKKGYIRFQHTEKDIADFLDQVYESLPSLFKKMVDDAVEEQSKIGKLTDEHKKELRRELANVIDQEIRLKGKFA